jgi:23S rRNA (guanosine2251-2'-O)-methyltransferase
MSEIIYGRNAAREALRARRRHIHRLLMADNLQQSAVLDEILALARQLRIPINAVPRRELDKLTKDHQGIILETGRYPTVNVEDILTRAAKLNEPPFIVALDHLEDPHNLGAMLRTAEAVGVHGVIIPKQRAVPITSTVVNVSAGAAEYMWIAEVPNLVQELRNLKERNVWIVGVEKVAQAQPYYQANLTGSIALAIGSEGKGLSRLLRETCDFLIQLPMRGQIESLNASVACALIFYEVWRARGFKTGPK